ncbi:MAG TPA: hemolysin III family protein [Gaiellaceae bacterium]|nr:hemolysin III family protein [Gaiellaceae bacterium]
MRGVFHLYAFGVFALLGAALVTTTSGSRERLAVAAFGGCLVLTFGVSALYHRVDWRPAAKRVMRRLDHASIYLLIAGTYTPYGLLVLSGAWQFSILGVVWIGAALAIVQRLFWLDAPRWVPVAAGIFLGWVGIVALPQIIEASGLHGTALVAAGGLLYTLGAVVYAFQWPDVSPTVFGFHELFHVLTVLAASCQFAAVALLVA